MQNILNDLNNDFFARHNDADIKAMIKNSIIDEGSIEKKWLGYSPATEHEIQNKEKLLGVILPPSYKEFLKTSNGFRYVSSFLDNLFSIDKIDWAKNTEEEWWFDLHNANFFDASDEEYFVYGKEQRPECWRDKYLEESLKISEWFDGMCVFLNPMVKHGLEWEVLVYATWSVGVARYRSFKEYLIATHQINMGLID